MGLPVTPYGVLVGNSKFTDRLRRIERRLDEQQLQDGVGYRVTRMTKGTTLEIKRAAGGGGGDSTIPRWG